MTDKNNDKPKVISKDEAERLRNYAQGLDDPITHVVDYGDLGSDTQDTKNNK